MLAELIAGPAELVNGDVVVITPKVVSKAEGRLVAVDPDDPSPTPAAGGGRGGPPILRRRGNLIAIDRDQSPASIFTNAGIDLSNLRRLAAPPFFRWTPTARTSRIHDGLKARSPPGSAWVVIIPTPSEPICRGGA